MASTSSAARLEALTRRSAVTTRKAARGAVSVALGQVRITPRPQFPHTRLRNGLSAGAVGAPNSSAQCVQKRVSSSLFERPCSVEGCTRARCLILGSYPRGVHSPRHDQNMGFVMVEERAGFAANRRP